MSVPRVQVLPSIVTVLRSHQGLHAYRRQMIQLKMTDLEHQGENPITAAVSAVTTNEKNDYQLYLHITHIHQHTHTRVRSCKRLSILKVGEACNVVHWKYILDIQTY